MKFTLTRDQRSAIFNGGCPHIGGEGECPAQPGHVHRLSKRLSIRVTKVHTDRDGWWLRYVVQDTRHTVMSLKRTPSGDIDYDAVREAYSDENFEWDRLPLVEEKGNVDPAKASAYTGSAFGVVDDAGEGIDSETLERYASSASSTGAQMRAAKLAAKEREWQNLIAKSRELIEDFDPGDDVGFQRKKRQYRRILKEKEAA